MTLPYKINYFMAKRQGIKKRASKQKSIQISLQLVLSNLEIQRMIPSNHSLFFKESINLSLACSEVNSGVSLLIFAGKSFPPINIPFF